MAQPNVSLTVSENFFAQKRIALIGMSREKHHITATLLNRLEQQGYQVILVNPTASEIMGHRCFARVQDIDPVPDAALLFTAPTVTDAVVRDCASAGVNHIWLYGTGGHGSVTEQAVAF